MKALCKALKKFKDLSDVNLVIRRWDPFWFLLKIEKDWIMWMSLIDYSTFCQGYSDWIRSDSRWQGLLFLNSFKGSFSFWELRTWMMMEWLILERLLVSFIQWKSVNKSWWGKRFKNWQGHNIIKDGSYFSVCKYTLEKVWKQADLMQEIQKEAQ